MHLFKVCTVVGVALTLCLGGTASAEFTCYSCFDIDTERVSVSPTGADGNGHSPPEDGASYSQPSVSSDGRYVAFVSDATNLVPDTNANTDVFVRDVQANTTTRVSVSTFNAQGNGISRAPSISADGRFVAFESDATNLVSGDDNGTWDVFVRDRTAGTTKLVSAAPDGTPGNGCSFQPSISDDGKVISFTSTATDLVASDLNGTWDVFVRDLVTSSTSVASLDTAGLQSAEGSSSEPSTSSDGRYVAFTSMARLVPEDTTCYADVYVRDRVAGTTVRASVGEWSAQGNEQSRFAALSGDGTRVLFISMASNLVMFDTNGQWDAFLRDLATGKTSRVDLTADGKQPVAGIMIYGPGSISGDGKRVAFTTGAKLTSDDTDYLMDVYVRNLSTGSIYRASVRDVGSAPYVVHSSALPALSGSGLKVAFASDDPYIVPGDDNAKRDVFVR